MAKILPCHALRANFLFSQLCKIITSLESYGAQIVAVVNNNNRVNESVFSKSTAIDQSRPWTLESPFDSSMALFLLYDSPLNKDHSQQLGL
ncbi:hypothetical protein PoB_005238200 [Plakobranchus ocellatus]|uniref:Uncharacterized protein n=1 Tax=Plakobranchus ocellatus TaxID=259542 RepID=A0AAV4C3Q5_9GAST|nr:hypothetical protein PoB_005238200 [Plakobranchus ocellatus]